MTISNVVPINILEVQAQEACLELARGLANRDFDNDRVENKYPAKSKEYYAYQARIIMLGGA